MPASTHAITTIVELQRALDELHRAERRLETIPDWMQDLHAEHTASKEEIAALAAGRDEADRERRAAEAGAGDTQSKLKHYQAQISLVRTQREYGALLHEIDTAKVQLRHLEELALAAFERQEEAAQAMATKVEAFQELDGRYGAELAKWEAEKPAVAEEVDRLKGRIEVLRERLPRPLLLQFDRIFTRYNGEAMALIMTMDRGGRGAFIWHCGACNYRVRPQTVVEIRNNGSLVQCDSCKRILYLDEAAV